MIHLAELTLDLCKAFPEFGLREFILMQLSHQYGVVFVLY